ncbi:MAG: GAF domain-containing protein, partial [Anaerolineales bacterium]|nr:GAF domain-containing protein [Anaerolineales bacterium]
MFADTAPLAFLMILIGLSLLVVAVLVARFMAGRAAQALVSPVSLPAEATADTAVLIAQTGGKILSTNPRAREMLGLSEGALSLGSILRQVRPSDTFLDLLSASGTAFFSLGQSGQQVEATSVHVPSENGTTPRVVMLFKPTTRALELGSDERSTQAISALSEISRAISTPLEMPATLEAILTQVGRVFHYDVAEITVWDERTRTLRPAKVAGNRDYERAVMRPDFVYAMEEGLSGWLAARRMPLVLADLQTFTQARPKVQRADIPLHGYAGLPLIANQKFLGTLELASFQVNTYKLSDLPLLNAIAGQAAVAVQNAFSYASQQKRVAELTSLTEITRAIEASGNIYELYRRLTDDIARLMDVQMAGILLYSEVRQALVGQMPFRGLPDILTESYNIPVAPNSLAHQLWQNNAFYLSNDVLTDSLVGALGLKELAETAGVRTTLLAPIALGERRLGVLQVSNQTNGAPFTEENARLLSIFAGQIAVIIENSRLVREAQTRAEQSEGLRQLAHAAAEGTDFDRVLANAMQQLARLLKFDAGVIGLLDETRGELRPHAPSIFGDPENIADIRIHTDDPMFRFAVTRTRRPFISGNALRDRRIVGVYRPVVDKFQAQSVLDVPLVVGDRCLGELMVISRQERHFSRADLQLLSTVGAQLAATIERTRLYTATDQSLQRRVDQLTALTNVSREINQTVELDRILELIQAEAVRVTGAKEATIVLLDVEASQPTVERRVGGADIKRLQAIEDAAAQSGRVQRTSGPPAALVVPIITQEITVGLIHVWSQTLAEFDDAAVEATEALSAQTAIAVANAQRYNEQLRRSELLRRRADQLAQLLEISRAVRSDKPLADNLEAIAFGLQAGVGFNVVAVHLLDPNTRRTQRVAVVGLPLKLVDETRHVETPWDHVQKMMREEFRVGQSYFLPFERAAHLTTGSIHWLMAPTPERPPRLSPNAWHQNDILIVPLIGSGTEPLGFLSLNEPRDNIRPDRSTLEVIEIFANQAALAVENVRLFTATERRAQRLLALHRVVEKLNSLTNREQITQTAAETLHREMKFDLVLIAMQNGEQLHTVGQAGKLRPEVKLDVLLRQTNPLAHTIEQNYPTFSNDVKRSDWAQTPFALLLGLNAFMATPITVQGHAIGALMVGSQQLASPFAVDDIELFIILCNQLSAELEGQRLETDVQIRAAQLAALAEASRTITGTLRTEDVINATLGTLKSVVPYDSVTLWLRGSEQEGEADVLTIAAAQGFESDAERLGLTVNIADSVLFTEMARTGGVIYVPDVREDPERFPGGEYQPTRSWLGAPLIRAGRIIGALALDKTEAGFYTTLSTQMLLAYANQAAVALDNARLFEENERRTAEAARRSSRLALLNRISAEFGASLEEENILETLAHEIKASVGVARVGAFRLTESGQAEALVNLSDDDEATALPATALARLHETLSPLTMEDITREPLVAGALSELQARGVKSLLILPLVASRALVGVVQVEETHAPRRFTPGEIELAQTLCNQAALAAQNARLFSEAQLRALELSQRNDRMRSLNALSASLTQTLETDALLRETAEQLAEMFAVDHVSMLMVDEHTQAATVEEEHPPMGALGLRLALSADAVGHQVLARRVVIISDVATDQRLSEDFRTKLTLVGIKSLLLAPFVSQGRSFGAFTLDSLTPRSFTTDEIEVSQTIAAQIASSLTNAQFARNLEDRVAERTKEVQKERERVETLLQITTELSSSLELDRVLFRSLQLVTDAVGATQGSIFTVDENDHLIYRAALGSPKVLTPGGERAPFKKHEGLVGWVIKNRQPAVIGNLDTDTRWKKIPGQNVNHKSALAVPLIANEEVLGGMLLFSPMYNAFDEDVVKLASAAANQVGAASNNAELYRLLRDQAERLGVLLRQQQVETTKNRAILEGLADGVLVADTEGDIIVFNSSSERILSLRRERALGRPLTEFLGLFGSAGREWGEAIQRWSEGGAVHASDDILKQTVELEDKRVLAVSLAPVLNGEDYMGVVSLIRDVTREVEIDRMKSDLVTMVSHELRTPITPIKASAELLRMGAGGPLTPRQVDWLSKITENADRLTMLVNDLLDRSRIESGKIQLVMGPIGVRDIINSTLEMLRAESAARQKPMNVRVELPDDLPAAWGDHT